MKSLIISGGAALALSVGIAGTASVGSCTSLNYPHNQQQLQTTPGYSTRTGGAQIGDGSSPGYFAAGAAGTGG